MPKTLLWYLLREMGKTFVLTAIGLTLLLSLGGGVRNLLKGEGLGTVEVLQVLSFVVPGAFTLSLPVAGLFSATMAYGRFAADNEMSACRAVGVNAHLLLTPVLCLGLVIALVTFWFSNYVIPDYVKDLNRLVGKNAFRIVMNELLSQGTFEFRGNVIHVDRIQAIEEDTGDTERAARRFAAVGGAFMELSGDRPLRVATTEKLWVEFDRIGTKPRVRAVLSNVRGFDLEKDQFYEAEQQPFGPFEIPRVGVALKPKWMTLSELRRYKRRPGELPGVREGLNGLRALLRRYIFYTWMGQQLRAETGPDGGAGHVARFGTDHLWYEVRAEKFAAEHHTARPRLKNPRIIEHARDRTREIKADLGVITTSFAFGQDVPTASVALDGNVLIVDSTAPGKPIRKPRLELPGVPILLKPPFDPRQILDQEAVYTDAVLLDDRQDLALGKQIDNARASLIADMSGDLRRIRSVMHSRSAFCFSVLVTMMLGASLGVVLRGGHVMTAFGISFAPALFVIATIAMGRQVLGHPHTVTAGILIIWGSVLLVGVLDALVLYKGVRR